MVTPVFALTDPVEHVKIIASFAFELLSYPANSILWT